MKSIFNEFQAGMDHIYNSFFISFLALKPLLERPMADNFVIPINGFSFNTLEAYQLNALGQDSINEYVNSIRRHMINDIVICYERYASLMFTSHQNRQQRCDPANIKDTSINASKFENLDSNLYTQAEIELLQQLRRLRNSIVHFNGVYTVTNNLDYTFHKNKYLSKGHEGENITVELDTLIYIHKEVNYIVSKVQSRYNSIYPIAQ